MLFSLLSAALFASSPLHCESISFVSGRDNVISAFFYLLSLWCFVRNGSRNSKKLLTGGVISFWIALLSKEMAIGLPAVLAGIGFFLPEVFKSDYKADSYSLKERCRIAINESKLLWLSAAIYLLVRYLALGTFTGGYTGSIGAGLMSTVAQRWTDIKILIKIIYPFNSAAFGVLSQFYWAILSALYTILGTLIIVKFLSKKYSLNILGFLVLWVLTTIVPIYQLWGLGENLQGARFYFFLSIPLAIFLPLLLLSPAIEACTADGLPEAAPVIKSRSIETLAAGTMILLVILSINITCKNNVAWLHASKQTKACLLESQKLAETVPLGKKIVVLGLPKEQDGAHVIYNGSTFNVMMSPPFSQANYTDKFITFDPMFYGQSELINAQRLRSVLSNSDVMGLFVWNEKTLTFDQLQRPSSLVLSQSRVIAPIKLQETEALAASITSNQGVVDHVVHQICINDQGLLMAPSNFDPYEYDFLEFKIKTAFPRELMFVFWKGLKTKRWEYCDSHRPLQKFISNATSPISIRIRLSDRWQWFTQGNINRLQLEFVPGQSVQVTDMQLVSARDLIPVLSIPNYQPNNIGVYSIKKGGDWLNFDAVGVKNRTAIRIEISKPNYFFEDLPEEQSRAAVMTVINEHRNKGSIHIPDEVFAAPGSYQLRALCLDSTGQPVGERSDPVTICFAN